MTFRAILFDLDNTLVDRDRALGVALGVALEDRADRAATLAEILSQDASGACDRRSFGSWLDAHHPELLERLPALDGDLGVDPGDAAWRRLGAAMLDHIRPDPAVDALLEELRGRYRLAVVSNGGRDSQRRKLRQAGLEARFETVLISAEQGCAKPAVEIFTRALKQLGVSAEQALFVGDHPRHDVVGACAAGLQTCWVAGGRSFPDDLPAPSFEVQRVTELPGVLP